jgi:integrase
LNSAQITDFVTDYARRLGPTAAQAMTTALRSFLRFLQQRGDVARDLASSVPSVARWQLASLPAILTPDDIGRLVGECDGRTGARRDRAIVVLLSRLGLRACEVVRLTLDDIDWNAGELTIRGKARRSDRMPLSHDVGAALAAYIRDERPRCASRRVFVRARAPHEVSVVHHRSVPSYADSFAGRACDEDAAPRTCFGMLPPPRRFVEERRFTPSATRSVTAICEADDLRQGGPVLAPRSRVPMARK